MATGGSDRHGRGTVTARLALLLAGVAALAVGASPAAAQDDDALYWAQRARTITVTATRTPTSLAEVPATVSVITAQDIADQMATDIKDLVRFEPGVTVPRSPARFGAGATKASPFAASAATARRSWSMACAFPMASRSARRPRAGVIMSISAW